SPLTCRSKALRSFSTQFTSLLVIFDPSTESGGALYSTAALLVLGALAFQPLLQFLDLFFDFPFPVVRREKHIIEILALLFPLPLHPVEASRFVHFVLVQGVKQFSVRVCAGMLENHLVFIEAFETEYPQTLQSLQTQESGFKAAIQQMESFIGSRFGCKA